VSPELAFNTPSVVAYDMAQHVGPSPTTSESSALIIIIISVSIINIIIHIIINGLERARVLNQATI
jgi:hypothetical protein